MIFSDEAHRSAIPFTGERWSNHPSDAQTLLGIIKIASRSIVSRAGRSRLEESAVRQ
jgi:hypothetical protein